MRYKHLNIIEREKILLNFAKGLSISEIAKIVGRNKSTISRELKRNGKEYSPSKAQNAYCKRRKKSCQMKKLADPKFFAIVKNLFLNLHWSPEQIANRLKLESEYCISYRTIYRAIYSGMFDTAEQKRSQGNRGARRKLRHKGKPRRPKGYESNRGKIPITHELSERPVDANERVRFGDFEADTIIGLNRKSALLTLVDRKSRFLLCAKLSRVGSVEVEKAMSELLGGQPLQSVTPDRGREFQLHKQVTEKLGVEFYFPPPHQPWQRGTNENTNGLLREYFPKGFDFNELSEEALQAVVEQLNKRPRKCLGYKTPWEIWFSQPLHFV
jgi:IS30 family transposase